MCTTSVQHCVCVKSDVVLLNVFAHTNLIRSRYQANHVTVGHKALSDDPRMAWARTSLAIAKGQLAPGEIILPEWWVSELAAAAPRVHLPASKYSHVAH